MVENVTAFKQLNGRVAHGVVFVVVAACLQVVPSHLIELCVSAGPHAGSCR